MNAELQERFAKIFPEQAKNEEVLIFTRKHWFTFLTVFIILFFMLIVPIIILALIIRFYPGFFTGSMVNIIVVLTSMYILFVCGAFLISFINLYFDVMILTNKRIIDINQEGFFNREINELDILHVEDVRSDVTGFFNTLFDFGNVQIQTAGTTRNFIFNNMPHPRELCQEILSQYKKALEVEQVDDAKTLDKAEGLGGRTKHVTYNDIHGIRSAQNPQIQQTVSNNLPKNNVEEVKPLEEMKPVEIQSQEIKPTELTKPTEEIKMQEIPVQEVQPIIPKSSDESSKNFGNLEEGKFVNLTSLGDDDQVLIKFNLPKNNESEVLKFLPALKSPTINKLADENFISIETVVKKNDIDEVLEKLLKNNASGIIQTDIKVL